MVPHFPQIDELRPRFCSLNLRRKTRPKSKTQAVSNLAIPDAQANLTFHSRRIVTHTEFETAVPGPALTASGTPKRDRRIATSDTGSSNATSQDVQLALSYALRSPDRCGKFGADESVTGKIAVHAGLQRIRFLQSFQQAPACP